MELGGTCRYLLGTGEFVSGFLNSIGVGLALLPVVIFVVAAFIGFAWARRGEPSR